MSTTLVKYRTSDVPYNQYAAVPIMFLPDLLNWLELSESAEVVSVSHDREVPFDAPTTWPAHRECAHYYTLSDIIAGVR